MITKKTDLNQWSGLNEAARQKLETRNYSEGDLVARMGGSGVSAGELITHEKSLTSGWIPGVEVFSRQVYQQKGRGYFSELTRLSEGKLHELGLQPQQWASALMHRESAKGFHIHPPYIPEGENPENWFQKQFLDEPVDYSLRNYDREQWDVMFFLMGRCEMLLVDERKGMPRRQMRFTIAGDSQPGPDNAAVVIPPGVAHALRSLGNEDLIMTYGTSTTFNPEWEGRIASAIESYPLPDDWQHYLQQGE